MSKHDIINRVGNMREITRQMIKKYYINRLKYDFMGYEFDRNEELSFHHLIIPKRKCQNMEHKGYEEWNGAILVQDTAHEYLHKIEIYDRDIFEYITKEMILENTNCRIDMENITRINDALGQFEKEYLGMKTPKGNEIVKEDYIIKRKLQKNGLML